MPKKNIHIEVLRFIKSVRDSFPDASIIYTFGACYGFYKILKTVFPDARPYSACEGEHVITKIGGKFYDIDGECIKPSGETKYKKTIPITGEQQIVWETVVSGQRVEHMIRKYNEN